jgi:hypothetical protein
VSPEIVIDTEELSPGESAERILTLLEELKLIPARAAA